MDGSAEKIQKETSIMHGAEVRDYLGRGYLYPPQDINVDLRGMLVYINIRYTYTHFNNRYDE